MKKWIWICLIALVLMPAACFAYEPVEFTIPMEFGRFTVNVPEGWTVIPVAHDPTRTDIGDRNFKKKDHGVMIVFDFSGDEQVYTTFEEGMGMLESFVKEQKLKEYELRTIANCPAICFTDTVTFWTVRKTYIHDVIIMGQHGALNIQFTTRGKDKALQAAEFEKILATVITTDALPALTLEKIPE